MGLKLQLIVVSIITFILAIGCGRLLPDRSPPIAVQDRTVEAVTPQTRATAPAILVEPVVTNTPAPTDVIVNLPKSELDVALDRPPSTWPELTAWLESAWQSNLTRAEALAVLTDGGWALPDLGLPDVGQAGHFAQADLTGDGVDEWIVSVRVPNSLSHAPTIPFQRAYPGNLFVIGQSGTLYQHYPTLALSAEITAAPFLLSLSDITGDGLPDLVIDELSHNGVQYFGRFYLLSAGDGIVRDFSSAEFKRVRPQPQLTIDNATTPHSFMLRVRYADSPTAENGYWQQERYQWNGGELALTNVNTEKPPTESAVAAYLQAQWAAQTDAARVRASLLQWGWLQEEQDWVTGDFDGDLRDDWAIVIGDPAVVSANAAQYPAEVWVLSKGGLFRLASEGVSAEIDPPAQSHSISRIADMTGDGRPELLVEQTTCGASTCTHTVRIVSTANGTLANIVRNTAPATVANQTSATAITQTFADIGVATFNDGSLPQLRVFGGGAGAAGAGIVRSSTVYWGWLPSENAIGYLRHELEPTTYRHLLLYEANDLTNDSNGQIVSDGIVLAAGTQLYQLIINASDLLDPEPFEALEPGPAMAAEQFAAFRLVYLNLAINNREQAELWMSFLEGAYSGEAMTVGARAMYDAVLVGGTPSAGCSAAQSVMSGYDNPVGALRNLGYANPSLSATDLCTP